MNTPTKQRILEEELRIEEEERVLLEHFLGENGEPRHFKLEPCTFDDLLAELDEHEAK